MKGLSRREFVSAMATALPGMAIATADVFAAPAAGAAAAPGSRSLSFTHLHTSERLSIAYYKDGAYIPEALGALNHLLRDFRTGEEHDIDPALFDLLHALAGRTGAGQPFQVISGFRSPLTNATLRQRSEGVAARSLHMVGQAIDIRVADVPLPKLKAAALALRRGGVGYYPASNFVHVDTGRVRSW